jgi:hypothetical protein
VVPVVGRVQTTTRTLELPVPQVQLIKALLVVKAVPQMERVMVLAPVVAVEQEKSAVMQVLVTVVQQVMAVMVLP